MDFKRVLSYLAILGITSFELCLPKSTRPLIADEACDPVVDMLFVMDNSTNISDTEFQAQKRFVSALLTKQKSPKGAARTAILVCDVIGSVSTPFTYELARPFESLDANISRISESVPQSCLKNVNYKIKAESRNGVSRIVVLLKGSWNWDDIQSQNEAAIARQEGTVLVVIAIGVRDFDSLSSLQAIALKEETFFVVSGYDKLVTLAGSLARDACKPISLDLTSEEKPPLSTTKQPTIARDPCIQLGKKMFKKYVPGFGYTRQRCSRGKRFDTSACTCV